MPEEFQKYFHIDNLFSSEDLVSKIKMKLKELGLESMPWHCFRKIDGSNVQVCIKPDGSAVFGSRNQKLDLDKEDFNGLKKVLERDSIEAKIRTMKLGFSVTKGIDEDKFSFIVFGELYGGLYRHPDVQRDKEAQRIQGRIDYSPSNHWMAFDAVAVHQDGTEEWLDWDLLRKLCFENGIDCQIEDFSGTLDECLAFSPVFIDDTGHRLFGLPMIDGNLAEGVVIKPEKMFFIGQTPAVLKNKNPKYKERIRATKASSLEAKGALRPLEQEWAEKLCEFMNEPRAFSAKSKLGDKATFSEIMEEACRDALADFKEELGEELEAVQRANDPKDFDFHRICKALSKAAVPCVRAAYLSTSETSENK